MPAKVDVAKCEGCGNCVDVCAVGAITIVDDKAVIKEEDCCECNACLDECDPKALTVQS